jgi:hypothetical protein
MKMEINNYWTKETFTQAIQFLHTIFYQEKQLNSTEVLLDVRTQLLSLNSKIQNGYHVNTSEILVIIIKLIMCYGKNVIENNLFDQFVIKIKQIDEHCLICNDHEFNEYIECSHQHLICYDCYKLLNQKDKCCVCTEVYNKDLMIFNKN